MKVALKYVGLLLLVAVLLRLCAAYLLLHPDKVWIVMSVAVAISMSIGTALAFRSKWLDHKYREALIKPEAELSQRELEVFRLLLGNKTNRQISEELFIELSTLKSHINSIYKKLGVKRRVELRKRYSSEYSLLITKG